MLVKQEKQATTGRMMKNGGKSQREIIYIQEILNMIRVQVFIPLILG